MKNKISNPRTILRNKNKNKQKEFVLLLHKFNLSSFDCDEYIYNVEDFSKNIKNIEIKNIFVRSDVNDIEVLYPCIDNIYNKLKDNLTKYQKRKFKIFKLLEEL